jgi:hypothetical protein
MKSTLAWIALLAGIAFGCGSATIAGGHDRGATGGLGGVAGGYAGASAGAAGTRESAGGNGGAVATAGASGGGASGTVGGVPGTGGNAGAGGSASGTGGSAPGTGGSGVTCAAACSSIQSCVGTQCLLKNGQSCNLASDCASNTCTAFFVDVDGDGYGAGQAMGFCGTTAPVGYAAMNGDCCDNATNLAVAKLIHPGADFQTTSAGGVCNITWDYDCSGTVESNPKTVACGQTYPACTTAIVDFAESSCGTGEDMTCVCGGAGNGTTGSCATSCGGHPTVTISCR